MSPTRNLTGGFPAKLSDVGQRLSMSILVINLTVAGGETCQPTTVHEPESVQAISPGDRIRPHGFRRPLRQDDEGWCPTITQERIPEARDKLGAIVRDVEVTPFKAPRLMDVA